MGWVRLHASGRSAHAAYPWKGANAAHRLLEAYAKIQRLFPTPRDQWQSTVTLSSLTTAIGGTNQVPASAAAVLDVRFTERLARTPQELLTVLRRIAPEVRYELLTGGPILNVATTNRYLRVLQASARRVLGRSVPFGFNHGTSDGRYFAEYGIPVMVSGIVGANHHEEGEYATIQSLVDYYYVVREFIHRFPK